MKIHDVSLTIHPGMPVWPGDPVVQLSRIEKIEEGANANVSFLGISVHTGTHVDAPFHFLPDGSTVAAMPLDILVGPVQVVELDRETNKIDGKTVKSIQFTTGIERVLFKTRNSLFWNGEDTFHTDFVGITADGARELVDRKIKLVGIDYLSIAPYKQSRPTHEILLKAGMVVIEGVELSKVAPGVYTLYCLPMKLLDTEGAPARTILVES